MTHNHKFCMQHKLKFCSICNIVYCEECNKEWTEKHYYHTIYPSVKYDYRTDGTITVTNTTENYYQDDKIHTHR